MIDNDVFKPDVYATKNYIVRKYNGVRSVSDMAQVNQSTKVEMGKFIKLKKPVRILLNLQGTYDVSFEIYEEALRALSYNAIERIAMLQPSTDFLQSLSNHTVESYQGFIKYRQFADEKDAKLWLNED